MIPDNRRAKRQPTREEESKRISNERKGDGGRLRNLVHHNRVVAYLPKWASRHGGIACNSSRQQLLARRLSPRIFAARPSCFFSSFLFFFFFTPRPYATELVYKKCRSTAAVPRIYAWQVRVRVGSERGGALLYMDHLLTTFSPAANASHPASMRERVVKARVRERERERATSGRRRTG